MSVWFSSYVANIARARVVDESLVLFVVLESGLGLARVGRFDLGPYCLMHPRAYCEIASLADMEHVTGHVLDTLHVFGHAVAIGSASKHWCCGAEAPPNSIYFAWCAGFCLVTLLAMSSYAFTHNFSQLLAQRLRGAAVAMEEVQAKLATLGPEDKEFVAEHLNELQCGFAFVVSAVDNWRDVVEATAAELQDVPAPPRLPREGRVTRWPSRGVEKPPLAASATPDVD